eukprot:c12746_g1_i1.p1 GENE.c12746_g1_i1~~c12746_g1_i1.p1  ORF type:complete len:215 (-),score=20.69 c12746_g1_i1:42-686(-)
MNIFRLAGDLLHLLSIVLLLLKIKRHKTCAGVSLKTQELYGLVFVTRYLDIVYNFTSIYNTVFKIMYLASSGYIIYLMRGPLKIKYDAEHDSFNVLYLLGPCVVLALIFNYDFSFTEILWAFSEYLEAVALFPQLFMLIRYKEIEALTANYIAALGAYRVLYVFNWIYRLSTEDNYSDWIAWIAGLVHTCLYADFAYHYFQARLKGHKTLRLPA